MPGGSAATRCEQCRAKLGLLPFKCRCERIFCAKHVQADQHNCNFDYKKDGNEKLKKQLDNEGLNEKMIKL